MAFAPSVAHKPVAAAVCPVMAAAEALATEGGLEARGAIFTRSEVVDFILDLAGYTEDQPLQALLIKSKVGWSLPNPPGGLS